ncbi:MAG: hypothetical protein M0P91_08710 [Sulfuricurvum sp.]|jgi:hypothetical protein|uniref:hypothetical protein n=1 Tax=Sulfuricurvum sp. TaxID=2025608 RepID=UPI0025FC87D4|nr:hypothetical protein [Sulfuricurvum sp.]MCK9373266.1 hypothetical protein [Sulfuricurvum sp.]
MDHPVFVKFRDTQNNTLANLLEVQTTLILEGWKNQPRVKNVLLKQKIDPDFFIKHFGARVLEYFIGVLRQEKLPGQCPVIIVMLKFFGNHGLGLDDIYQICAGKRNTVIHTLLANGIAHDDILFVTAIEQFDINFTGVIQEYIALTQEKRYPHHDEKLLTCNLDPIPTIDPILINDYFAVTDPSQDKEKVLFRIDDADDILEYFSEMSEQLSLAALHRNPEPILYVAAIFSKVASILLHYTPYLDSLAASMSELSTAMYQHTDPFMSLLLEMQDGVLKLFDGVNADMDRYIQRFSVENIAMKNTHHIHEPTSLSIRQIIEMFAPSAALEDGIDFF